MGLGDLHFIYYILYFHKPHLVVESPRKKNKKEKEMIYLWLIYEVMLPVNGAIDRENL